MKRLTSILLALCLLCATFLLPTASAEEAEMPEYQNVETNDITSMEEIQDAAIPDMIDDMSHMDKMAFADARAVEMSGFFGQEELDDPNIWYAVPDRVVELAATPTNNAYARLKGMIEAAPANQITHIIIPFHINIGNVSSGTMTVVGIRDGATVVLIGDHPTAENGQVVISDTHGNGGVSRIFRVRGDGTEHSGLVLRNIVLQTAAQAAASIPATAPAPLAPSQQTGNARSGGATLEPGAVSGVSGNGGGGHLILCRGSVIRNSSTDNNGPVDVQTDGRFTMMPGSEMHTNVAGNSGGAVHVNTRGTFNMYGGVIRGNLARGERIDANQARQRAVGGAVFVQNGGTFNMYDGEIFGNQARLGEISAAPSATNAIVTSSGGAVFVTGTASSFHMYGGTIWDNHAVRTRTSGLATGNTTAAIQNRDAYRAGNGGGVYLTGGATFHMYGGTISENSVTNTGSVTNTLFAINGLNLSKGGGVYLTGSGTRFNMYGGEIVNNQVIQSLVGPFRGGGGVAVDAGATFELYDGQIARNTASALQTSHFQGGGGVLVGGDTGTAVSSFIMHGGEITNNTATYAGTADTGPGEGGGVFVSPLGNFTMYGGAITHNTTRSNARGGGGVFVAGGRFTATNPSDSTTERLIANNKARGHGGGILIEGTAAGHFPSGIAGEASIAEGTIIRDNHAGIEENLSAGVGLGGGVLLVGRAMFTIEGGEISGNVSLRHGGGIAALENSTIRMQDGLIFANHARADVNTNSTDNGNGGGISISNDSILQMTGGKISANTADRDGGGIFVPHSNLLNITIAPAAAFSDNIAHNGMRVDNALAESERARIHPDTVSVNGSMIDEFPVGSGNYREILPHVFTNYDINAIGSAFWRVTHELQGGEGSTLAQIGNNKLSLTSGVFVPDESELTFTTQAEQPLGFWAIGTRLQERMWNTEQNAMIDFPFVSESSTSENPLAHRITAHTHVIAHLKEEPLQTTLTISKTVTGDLGNRDVSFDFTIRLTDVDGNLLSVDTVFDYTGNIIPNSGANAPIDGTLRLDDEGSARFQLSHGQSITIEGLPLYACVQVIETPNINYTVSFVDSAYADEVIYGYDTTMLPMVEGRTFSFLNEREVPPPTGMNLGNNAALLLLTTLLTISALGVVVFEKTRRKVPYRV